MGTKDYLIIGAGPAGLQLGYFLQKNQRDYLILEKGDSAGSFFKRFPRHDTLISINKVYTGFKDPETNLRWDWNSLLSDEKSMQFSEFCKDYFPDRKEMVRYLQSFAHHFDLQIAYGVNAVQISKNERGFTVSDQDGGTYEAKRLIVATGIGKPFIPAIPGIDLVENYADMPIDPQEFAGQRVLLIGKGNSAFETGNHLIGTTSLLHLASPESITFAWRTHYVGHIRSINNALLDSYLLKSQNVLIDAQILQIERRENTFSVSYGYSHADEELETIEYDRVIACTGFCFDLSPFESSCRPKMVINDRFPELTHEWESTNINDLYFAGSLMQSRDFKKKQSGFIHGFRYNIQLLVRFFEQKYHGNPLAFRRLEREPDGVTQAVIQRVNQSSSLWQQTGYFCDVITVQDDELRYYEDITVDYAHAAFGSSERYYVITLEFGQEIIDAAPDPFAVTRIHKDDVARSHLSTGIHPIIRGYSNGELVSTHHVIEDIASEFVENVHRDPLARFLTEEFEAVMAYKS